MRLEDIENTIQYFARTNMFTVLQMQREEADRAINAVNPDTLLNSPTDDLVKQIVDTYKLDVPVLLRHDAHMDEPREITISKRDYGRTIQQTGTILVLHVGLIPPASHIAYFMPVMPTYLKTCHICQYDHGVAFCPGNDRKRLIEIGRRLGIRR
jgi:hypothetical protein